MKIFIPAVFILLFISGCGKNEKKIEVVPDLDAVYLPASEVDVAAKGGENFKSEIVNDLTDAVKSLDYSSQNKSTEFMINIRLYINKNGKIDKIKNIQGSNRNIHMPDSVQLYPDREKLINAVASRLANVKFKHALKDGEAVKYRTDFAITIIKKTDGSYLHSELMYNNGESKFLVAVEQMPEPVGGIKAIQNKIKYPEEAKKSGIEGKVYVMAFIDEKGNVVKAKVLRGIGGGCDRAALNAVKETKFIPGRQRGKTVKVRVAVPIVFKLK